LDALVNDQQVKGPQGGISVSHSNVGRYLNNTQFVELVQDGWVGSSVEDTTHISELIRELLEQKHSVFLANSQATEGRASHSRGKKDVELPFEDEDGDSHESDVE